MRIPSLKAFLIFAAGFLSCVACIVAFIGFAYYSRAKHIQAKRHISLSPPAFFTPHPAEFDFTAVDSGGKQLDFKEYRGRVVVLNVWATWCMPCLVELPTFGKLAAHYSADKDVAVVCLSQEPANIVFKNAAAISSGAPLYSLGGQRLPGVFKTDGIPATFVIDNNGMIVFEDVASAADWSAPSVTRFIDSLRLGPTSRVQPTPR